MHKSFIALVLVFVFALGGCATLPEPQPRVLPSRPYIVDVLPSRAPMISNDGFEAGLVFNVIATHELEQPCLVQELVQTMTQEYSDGRVERESFSLVEAFRLRFAGRAGGSYRYELENGQFDRHFHTGLSDLPAEVIAVRIDRRVFAYLAKVRGADFTRKGFCQLACNETGDVITDSPPHFNENYRRHHETRGQPVETNRAGGVFYNISYRVERTSNGQAAFALSGGGGGRVYQPDTILQR